MSASQTNIKETGSRARALLYTRLKEYYLNFLGIKGDGLLNRTCNNWMDDESNPKSRYDNMRLFIDEINLKKLKILDMASGCGTFVFHGLRQGYDVYGIEPEDWKHEFNRLKAAEKGYPTEWLQRFSYGVGEQLPYKDSSFDIISTYQTLEHVSSQQKCFHEFYRVLKKDGYLFIKCPDYRSFFEGHYKLPMLPLMDKKYFKKFLIFLNRPTGGLDRIQYITKSTCIEMLEGKYRVTDMTLKKVSEKIYQKFHIHCELLTKIVLTAINVANIFRKESSVNLVAIKN